MNERCYFDLEDKCRALEFKDCKGCSFRKTKQEYSDAMEYAENILKAKGLKACTSNGIVTVVKR